MNWELKRKIGERFGSQFKFAHMLSIHESFVSKIVRERRKLSDSEKTRWAETLGVGVEEIFSEGGKSS